MPYFARRKKRDARYQLERIRDYFAKHVDAYYYQVEKLGEYSVTFTDMQGNQLVTSKEYAREHFYAPEYMEEPYKY